MHSRAAGILLIATVVLFADYAFPQPLKALTDVRTTSSQLEASSQQRLATLAESLGPTARMPLAPTTNASAFSKYVGRGVVFWHIPKTGGSSFSTAMFDQAGVLSEHRRPFTIENEDDCNQAIHRALSNTTPKFWHIHHKDFSMAIALRRAGFKLVTILRHPVLRAISEYNYKKYFRKIDPGFELNSTSLVKMVKEDNLVRTLTSAHWWWSVSCDWSKCDSKYCEKLQNKQAYKKKDSDANLRNALTALTKNFEVVHCLEHDDKELIVGVEAKFGLSLPAFPQVNANEHTSTVTLSSAEIDELRRTSVDYQLYLEMCGEDKKSFPS